MERKPSCVDDVEEDLDFSKDFRGFPLDKRTGSKEPRESVGWRRGVDGVSCGMPSGVGDSGEDLGKSTVAGAVGSPLDG
jgi:hypothetical protein